MPQAVSEERGSTFTGRVWADPLIGGEGDVIVNAVFFEPRARTYWHRHSGAQILYVTHGEGWLQSRNGAGGRLLPGDVAHISAHEEHWHGAAPASFLLHVAISFGEHEWLEPVSEAEYGNVFAAENA
jgi:quercetin dioxygenase-like cupin family protein